MSKDWKTSDRENMFCLIWRADSPIFSKHTTLANVSYDTLIGKNLLISSSRTNK